MEVDLVGVSRIVSACGTLQGGAKLEGGLWSAKTWMTDTLFNDSLEFQALFGDLASLKRARSVLTALQVSIHDDIARLEKEVYLPALHHGISSIPDEILEKIIVTVVQEIPSRTNENNSVRDLAMVSKRFHRVVNACREAWANINLQDGYYTIEHKLSKAGESKLAITIKINDGGSRLGYDPDALQLLDEHMCNCSYLHLCPSGNWKSWHAWDTVTFPSTTMLVLANGAPFPEQWTFPNLRILHAMGRTPPTHLFANLTHLELHNFNDSAEALQAACRLETLVLHDIPFGGQTTFSMPKLASLTVYAFLDRDRRGWLLDEVARFTRNLRAPTLVAFHLHLKYVDLQGFLPTEDVQFFPTDIPMDRVKDISFDLIGQQYDEDTFDIVRREIVKFIPSFLSRFPSLEGFTLHATEATDSTRFLLSLEPILLLRRFHVYGIYDELAFLPRIINALENSDAADVKLREVILHAKHNSKIIEEWALNKKRFYHEPLFETKVMLEHRIGKTVISVMETTDLRQGELEAVINAR